MDAVFTWACPTWGCKGHIILDTEPEHDTRAICQARGGPPPKICGREMRWDFLGNVWLPISPFTGFITPPS